MNNNNEIISTFKPPSNWFLYIPNDNNDYKNQIFRGFPFLISYIYWEMEKHISSNFSYITFTELDSKQRHTLYIWLYNMNSKFRKCKFNNKTSISIEINEEWNYNINVANYSNEFSTYTYIPNHSIIFNNKLNLQIQIKNQLIEMIDSIKNNINYQDYDNILKCLLKFQF